MGNFPPDMDTPLSPADQVLVNAAIALVSAHHAASWRPVLVQAVRDVLPRVTAAHPMMAQLTDAAHRFVTYAHSDGSRLDARRDLVNARAEMIRARGDMDRALVDIACWRLGHILESQSNG